MAQNLGIDRVVAEQKLDVNGSVRIGNTTTGVGGSIRWTGTELQFHDGTSWIVLSESTDNQILDVIQLNGTDLEISIEGDGLPTYTISLSSLMDNTDVQQFDQVSINASNQLLLSLSGDGQPTHVLDFSGYLDNTDEQQLDIAQLSGTDLQLSLQNDGVPTNIIDMSAFAVDEDNQALDVAQLNGTNLELSLEDDATATQIIDLSSLADNTDDQTLDVINITSDQLRISLENDGQTTHVLDLSPYKDNTDDQGLDVVQLTGNTLGLSLESDGQATQTVDLTSLSDNTDDQVFDVITIASDELRLSIEDDGQATHVLSLAGYLDNTDNQVLDVADITSNNLRLSLENDGEAPHNLDLTPYLDNTDDQGLDVAQLTGNTLQLSLENDGVGTYSLDLSGYLDNTDEQGLDVVQLLGNSLQLSLENDGVGTYSFDLSGYLDNTDDQKIDNFAILPGNLLSLEFENDGQAPLTVNLSGYLDNTDDQSITDLSLSGTILTIQVESDAGGAHTVDMEPLRRLLKDANGDTRVEVEANPNEDHIRFTTDGTGAMIINPTQQVGIGLTSGLTNRLVVNGSGTDATSTLGVLGGNEQSTFSDGAQIAFGYSGTDGYQHFIHTRHNSSGGSANNSIDFYVSDGTQNNSLTSGSTRVVSMNSGNVGVGTIGPNRQLEVVGTTRISTLAGGGTRLVTTDNAGNLTAATSVPAGMGDNLGNHTATTNLNMSNAEVDNVGFLDITPGYGNGIRFWSDNLYAIAMGNAAEYHYGPVTDYSIKYHMSGGTPGRGWTWGVDGLTPVAAINTLGAMQIQGTLKVSNDNTTGGGLHLADDGGIYDRNDGYASFAFSAGTDLEDAQDPNDHLQIRFDDSYPEIWSYWDGAAEFTEFRTGMFNNGGTFYSQNQIYARSGIANDYTTLLLNDAVRISGLAGTGNRIVMANAAGDLYTQSNLNGTGLGDNLGNHQGAATLDMNSNVVTEVTDLYLYNWQRHNDNDGIYWSNNSWHIYPRDALDMNIRTGNSSGGLALMNSSGTRGYMHWTGNWQGWLNSGRQWQLRTRNNDGYSPNLYFDEEGNESWTGNPGADEGKLEYHSNRFYVAAGNNSTEIARFRRSGSDVGVVWNGGDAVFPVFIDWNNNNFGANPAQTSSASIYTAGRSAIDGLTVIDDAAGWHRSYNSTGWYNGSYGGGWQQSDGTWIRTYGNKSVHINRSGNYAFHPYSANHTPVYSISGTNGYWNGQFSGANYSVYAQGYVYATTYGYLSTRDKKKDIHSFEYEDYLSAWAFLDELNLNYYKYKDEGTTKGFSDAVQVGFIAEETPGALTTPGKKGVLYGELSIYNTAALKVLKNELKAIEEQLTHVKDFGIGQVLGDRERIEFSSEFIASLNGALPVVTVSAMGGDGELSPSVSGIDGHGFYVEKSEEGLVPFSWMAFAKINAENGTTSSNEYSNSFITMLESAEHEALTKQSPEPIEPLPNEFYDALEDDTAPWEGGVFPPEDALESAEKPQPNSVANATNSPTPETLLPAEDEKTTYPASQREVKR
jgi:hypothetical protein